MNGIFESGLDDYMFPTTQAGMREAGMVLECGNKGGVKEDCQNCNDKKKAKEDDDNITESAGDETTRSRAMSAVLDWVADGTHSYDAMDEYVMAVTDLDGDFEITEEEEAEYNDVWEGVMDALISMGCKDADVQAFIDGPSDEADEAGLRIGKYLAEKLETTAEDDEDLIVEFAGCGEFSDSASGIFEATYRKKRVVRDGKVVKINKRVSGKIRLSAAQKAGLRKARRKANTAVAKLHRRKSFKKGQQRGLHN